MFTFLWEFSSISQLYWGAFGPRALTSLEVFGQVTFRERRYTLFWKVDRLSVTTLGLVRSSILLGNEEAAATRTVGLQQLDP